MNEPRERVASVNGKRVLLALLATACVVPLITWGIWTVGKADLARPRPPLSWAQRASWPSPPVKRTTLVHQSSPYDAMHPPKSRWDEVKFSISPALLASVDYANKLARLAESEPDHLPAVRSDQGGDSASTSAGGGVMPTQFTDPAVGQRLKQLAHAQPEFFYPLYLLATWQRVTGQTELADQTYQRAFALAPAVIKLRYVDTKHQPMAGLHVGDIEIGCDRVIHGELDQSLVLVYPDLVTDAKGYVYLPIFHTVYRAARLPQPKGYEATYAMEGWFEFPGRVGMPKPVVVRKKTGTTEQMEKHGEIQRNLAATN